MRLQAQTTMAWPIRRKQRTQASDTGELRIAIKGGIVKIFRPGAELCDVNEPGEIFMRQVATSDFDYHGKAEARAEAGRDGLVSVGDVG
jgi:long-chain acyl-CoA synthetase